MTSGRTWHATAGFSTCPRRNPGDHPGNPACRRTGPRGAPARAHGDPAHADGPGRRSLRLAAGADPGRACAAAGRGAGQGAVRARPEQPRGQPHDRGAPGDGLARRGTPASQPVPGRQPHQRRHRGRQRGAADRPGERLARCVPRQRSHTGSGLRTTAGRRRPGPQAGFGVAHRPPAQGHPRRAGAELPKLRAQGIELVPPQMLIGERGNRNVNPRQAPH